MHMRGDLRGWKKAISIHKNGHLALKFVTGLYHVHVITRCYSMDVQGAAYDIGGE